LNKQKSIKKKKARQLASLFLLRPKLGLVMPPLLKRGKSELQRYNSSNNYAYGFCGDDTYFGANNYVNTRQYVYYLTE